MASALPIAKSPLSCPTLGQHLSRCNDFRIMHPTGNLHDSSQSLSSVNTDTDDCSTNTQPRSNTVRAHEKRQQETRRFLMFTGVLVKFLEKKNPALCQDAREVIQRCGETEQGGQNESICDSLKVPLKEAVGSAYWKQAKGYLKGLDNHDTDFEPIPLDDKSSKDGTNFDPEALSCLLGGQKDRKPPEKSIPDPIQMEKRLRRKRFWMLVRVLMKYLQKKDPNLYLRARAALEDCVKRKERNEENFTNLPECVQRELKKVVGRDNWRRAKYYLTKHLIRQAEEEACDRALAGEKSFGLVGESENRMPTNENHCPSRAAAPIVSTPGFAGHEYSNHRSYHTSSVLDMNANFNAEGSIGSRGGKRCATILEHETTEKDQQWVNRRRRRE
eukprot:scaffold4095_cov117-Cylindrotheca_fusiformis.AAC.11